MTKLEKLEMLTLSLIDDIDYEKNYDGDIMELIQKFNKKELSSYIYILLNSLRENENEMKKCSVNDGFAFWLEEYQENKMILEYEKLENYTSEEIINVIKEVFTFKEISVYSYEFGFYEKTFQKKDLNKIIKFLKENNTIIQIYVEEKILSIQVVKDNLDLIKY